ncbi:hypothetical protein P4233_00770 [Pseudomonas aeruginosa]|nr:hypothetical protein [Pseudomonas aeruginosa]
MPYRVLLLILALTPALASSATLDERLGDLEHAFKPDLDGTTSAKPASPPPERFKLAPLGSVVRRRVRDIEPTGRAVQLRGAGVLHGLRTVRWSAGNLTWRTTGPCRGSS